MSKAFVAEEPPPAPPRELMAMAKAAERLRSSAPWDVLGMPGIFGGRICPGIWAAIAAAYGLEA